MQPRGTLSLSWWFPAIPTLYNGVTLLAVMPGVAG